jgi:hypothetical protein
MPEKEVALLRRPTVVTLLNASRQGSTPFFFYGRPAESQARMAERTQNLPLNAMWRKVIEEAEPEVTARLASGIFKAAENRNEKGLLIETATNLATHFPHSIAPG